MKKVKEKIDVVCLKSCGRGEKGQVVKEDICGINVLNIRLKDTEFEKARKNVIKIIKDYDTDNPVLITDEVTGKFFGLEGLGYEVRRAEFLNHMDYLIKSFSGNSLLIVLGNKGREHFLRHELLQMLLRAKDIYRDITIYSEGDKVLLDITGLLYEEFGVVINVSLMPGVLQEHYSTALIFSGEGDFADISSLHFEQGYAVLDDRVEKSMGLSRYMRAGKERGNALFSGLIYEKAGRIVPYEIASNIAYQKRKLYEELEISFIDIYRLECYNVR